MEFHQAIHYYDRLKVKIGTINLKELLRPHYSELLARTVDPGRVAMNLQMQGKMTLAQYFECLNESTESRRNSKVYQFVQSRNEGKALIQALYETQNHHIIRLLLSRWDEPLRKKDQPPPARISDAKPKIVKVFNPNPEDLINNQVLKKSGTDSDKIQPNPTPIPPIIFTHIKGLRPFVPERVTVKETKPGTTKEKKEPSTAVIQKFNLGQILTLKANDKLTARPTSAWTQTVGEVNLSGIQEKNLDGILARVKFNNTDAKISRTVFEAGEIHPKQEEAIVTFLTVKLCLDLDKNSLARPPREVYINARSFTFSQWDWLSKFLYNFCQDTLEHLWFQNVDCREYLSGIKWMKNELSDQPGLRFTRLKFFILQGSHYSPDSSTFHRLLGLIKPEDYPIQDFWNKSGCQVQIWSDKFNRCNILMDPINGTLHTNNCLGPDFKDEIDKVFDPMSSEIETKSKQVPITKLYYMGPRIDLITNRINRSCLTHLFLKLEPTMVTAIIQNVVDNLSEFKLLQKLLLSAEHQWTIDLIKLDVLDRLSFLYLRNANVGVVAVDSYPWRKSVSTLVFYRCGVALATEGLDKVSSANVCMMLERNPGDNDRIVPSQPFRVSLLSTEDTWMKILKEFAN